MRNLAQLIGFRIELAHLVDEMLDELNTTGYDDKFNLKIETNGSKLELELHADLYERMLKLIDEEIDEWWKVFVTNDPNLIGTNCLTELDLAATRFLKKNDPNGDYDNWEHPHLYIEYFIWEATSDISDSAACMDGGVTIAMDIVKKAGQYHKAIEILIGLATSLDDETNYRAIWSHNVTGYINGFYTIK